jgi:FKBP-type peptidyl-prolyl cis-trans isomerase 2
MMKRVFMGAVPLLLLLLAVIGCTPATVANKKMVSINYTGTLADGSVFGQNESGTPLEFLVGGGNMIPALETALIGMKVGEKKTVTIKAADAYGEYDKTAIQDVPKANFPTDITLTVGQTYQMQTSSGTVILTVLGIKGDTVSVDFNHPLAGKDLTFAVEVVKIRAATKDELTASTASTTATPQ